MKKKDGASEKKPAASTPEPPERNKALTFLLGPGRWIIACIVLVAAIGVGWRTVWQQVRSHVLSDSQYQLTAERLQMTELPAWIRSDIKGDVLRNASLDASLSLLDDELTLRLAHALALSPWVAKVIRVSKSGTGVEAELEYRRPVAMVQVSGGVFPIDRQGVLLPNEDFTPADVKNYPRITDVSSEPTSPVGSVWRDARLAGAAALAELLADHWQRLKLQRITVAAPESTDGNRATGYTVYTQAGSQIRWGRSPMEKPANEMAAADKLSMLLQFSEEHGSLEGKEGRQVLDLQSGPTLRIVQRSQIVPLPKEADSE